MSDPLLAFDREHLWHPYTSLRDPLPVYAVESAAGTRLRLRDGRELVDGMSSWWSAIHGYAHPVLDAAIRRQLDAMAHVMFGGLTHEPAVELGRRLVELSPPGLDKVFFCDSGSVAVEVAIKMALQYWHARGEAQRHRLLVPRGGYHGDTFGAMALCDPVNGMHHRFQPVLASHVFAPRPECRYDEDWREEDGAALAAAVAEHHHELAGLVLEPIVQGAGGMRIYHPEYLRLARTLCDRHGLLLIADEIATGFGRTGRLFGCEHAGVRPDVMTVGKALTGGTMTLAATLTTDEVAGVISSADPGNLMHGPTFMANPLACAAAVASLDLLRSGDWGAKVAAIERQLRAGLEPARGRPGVADVRVLGAIGVLEMKQPLDVAATQARLVERGVWLRPFGRLLYTMPPYVVDEEDLGRIVDGMLEEVAVAGS